MHQEVVVWKSLLLWTYGMYDLTRLTLCQRCRDRNRVYIPFNLSIVSIVSRLFLSYSEGCRVASNNSLDYCQIRCFIFPKIDCTHIHCWIFYLVESSAVFHREGDVLDAVSVHGLVSSHLCKKKAQWQQSLLHLLRWHKYTFYPIPSLPGFSGDLNTKMIYSKKI